MLARASRTRRLWDHVVFSARGAIDLASILVGVLVMGILGSLIAASVFVVIPWAQDAAARANLDAVRTAQEVTRVKDGRFVDYADLTAAKTLGSSVGVGTITDSSGDCYVSASKSMTGTTFYSTSRDRAVLDDTAGFPDTGWCANAGSALDDRVRNFASDPAATQLRWPVAKTAGWFNNRWAGGGGGTGGYAQVTGAVDGPGPYLTSYARKTWTGAPADNGDTGFQNSGAASVLTDMVAGITVVPGETVTVSSWLRSSVGGKLLSMRAQSRGADMNRIIDQVGPKTWSQSGQWQRVSLTVTIPAGATGLTIQSDVLSHPSSVLWQPGDTLDGTGLMVERGAVAHEYGDGNVPGWAWAGVAGASVSSGYPYSPESLIGRTAELWLDASAPLGRGVAVPAEGTSVSQWADLSGKGRHASQTIANRQPTVGAGYVRFDGATDTLDTASLGGLTGTFSVYAVAYRTRSDTEDALIYRKNAPGGLNVAVTTCGGCATDPNALAALAVNKGGATSYGTSATGSTFRSPFLISTVASPTLAVGSVNGGALRSESAAFGDVPVTELSVGSDRSGSTRWWAGGIACVIVVNAGHSTAERRAIERVLAHKYGVPLP